LIVTVTANAAIDRTLRVESLEPGRKHAVLSDLAQAGGKGVNVARVLHALGVPTVAAVVTGGRTGEWILRNLAGDGIEVVPVEAPGDSRTCLEIVETGRGRVTQLHGRGVQGSRLLADKLVTRVGELLGEASWIALCGSLAEGLPANTYAQLVRRAHERRVRVALDTSGAALREAWKQAPELVRVNREEATQAVGVPASSFSSAAFPGAGRATLTVISDGASPSVAWTSREESWRIEPPRVDPGNPIGCGDAMLAGLLASLDTGGTREDPSEGEPFWSPRLLEGALRYATALASADVASPTAGRPDPARAQALLGAVRIHHT
jgi:tagatose 6-phosphate kinase